MQSLSHPVYTFNYYIINMETERKIKSICISNKYSSNKNNTQYRYFFEKH